MISPTLIHDMQILTAIDPKYQSVKIQNNQLLATTKRSCLTNFFWRFIHIISLTLVPLNPELNKVAKRILLETRNLQSSDLTADEKQQILAGITILERILKNDSAKAKISGLIQTVNKIEIIVHPHEEAFEKIFESENLEEDPYESKDLSVAQFEHISTDTIQSESLSEEFSEDSTIEEFIGKIQELYDKKYLKTFMEGLFISNLNQAICIVDTLCKYGNNESYLDECAAAFFVIPANERQQILEQLPYIFLYPYIIFSPSIPSEWDLLDLILLLDKEDADLILDHAKEKIQNFAADDDNFFDLNSYYEKLQKIHAVKK